TGAPRRGERGRQHPLGYPRQHRGRGGLGRSGVFVRVSLVLADRPASQRMTSVPHLDRRRTRSESESVLSGLTDAEVLERTRRGQTNDVPQTTSRPLSQIIRANVFTPFNALLGALLVVILIVGPIQDALFGVVLVANALVGIVQELRSKRTLDRLAALGGPWARVVGGGEPDTSNGLEIDESLLTGESEPVSKEVGDTVFSGSFAAAGTGRYRATRIGRPAHAQVPGGG